MIFSRSSDWTTAKIVLATGSLLKLTPSMKKHVHLAKDSSWFLFVISFYLMVEKNHQEELQKTSNYSGKTAFYFFSNLVKISFVSFHISSGKSIKVMLRAIVCLKTAFKHFFWNIEVCIFPIIDLQKKSKFRRYFIRLK